MAREAEAQSGVAGEYRWPDVLDVEPSRDVAASHPSPFAATRAIRISTQVKVEKKDESIEAMRKLMGGAADEEEEEGN